MVVLHNLNWWKPDYHELIMKSNVMKNKLCCGHITTWLSSAKKSNKAKHKVKHILQLALPNIKLSLFLLPIHCPYFCIFQR